MYLSEGKINGHGSTGWVLSGENQDHAGNMATMSFEIGICANEKGLMIGGEKNLITWKELEAAKAEAEKGFY